MFHSRQLMYFSYEASESINSRLVLYQGLMSVLLHRCSAANLTISSPLEAHKSHNIVFSIVGLDCGFDNAIFAAIELDYCDADQVCNSTVTSTSAPVHADACDGYGAGALP